MNLIFDFLICSFNHIFFFEYYENRASKVIKVFRGNYNIKKAYKQIIKQAVNTREDTVREFIFYKNVKKQGLIIF